MCCSSPWTKFQRIISIKHISFITGVTQCHNNYILLFWVIHSESLYIEIFQCLLHNCLGGVAAIPGGNTLFNSTQYAVFVF